MVHSTIGSVFGGDVLSWHAACILFELSLGHRYFLWTHHNRWKRGFLLWLFYKLCPFSQFVTEANPPSPPWFRHDARVLVPRPPPWTDWGFVRWFSSIQSFFPCICHYIHQRWIFSSRGELVGINHSLVSFIVVFGCSFYCSLLVH